MKTEEGNRKESASFFKELVFIVCNHKHTLGIS